VAQEKRLPVLFAEKNAGVGRPPGGTKRIRSHSNNPGGEVRLRGVSIMRGDLQDGHIMVASDEEKEDDM
jgi:hypothetical protein